LDRDAQYFGGIDNVLKIHIFYFNIIQELGRQLKMKQQVCATAVTYFRRFYAKHPLTAIEPGLLAQTAMHVAIKIEECGPLSTKSVCSAAQFVSRSTPLLKSYSPTDVADCEFFLIQELDSCLIVFHPYRPLVEYVEDAKAKDALLPTAWNIVNDSYRGQTVLLFPLYFVALAAIQIAATTCNVDLSEWFAELSVSVDEISKVVQYLLDVYAAIGKHNIHEIASLLQKLQTHTEPP
jgi:cyclin C